MAIRKITYPGAMWLASLIYDLMNLTLDVDIKRFTVNGNYNTETEITIDNDAVTSRRVKEINAYIDFGVNPAQAASYIDYYRTDDPCVGATDRIGQMYYASSNSIVFDSGDYSTTQLKALIRTYTNVALDVYFIITYYDE